MRELGLILRTWHSHTQSVAFEPLEKIAIALGVKPGDLIVSDEVISEGTKDTEITAA